MADKLKEAEPKTALKKKTRSSALVKRMAPEIYVIVDTNAIYSNDKALDVSVGFGKFWSDLGHEMNLTLLVPEVVRGELLFRRYETAIRKLKNITEQFMKISSITGKPYRQRINEQRLRREIESRFDKWLASVQGKLLRTPIESIDWADVIESSVWRIPPFELVKSGEGEKGFRDRLILESILSFISEKSNSSIAIICGDDLLSTTIKRNIESNRECKVYESVEDFESYLKLRREEMTDNFISSVLVKASKKFYTQADPNCLYVKEGIWGRISKTYETELNYPEELESPLAAALSQTTQSKQPSKMTQYSGNQKVWILGTQLEEVTDGKRFVWKTPVRVVRLFGQDESTAEQHPLLAQLMKSLSLWTSKILKLDFHVLWEANVGHSTRFDGPKLLSIELNERNFQRSTPQELTKHGFD